MLLPCSCDRFYPYSSFVQQILIIRKYMFLKNVRENFFYLCFCLKIDATHPSTQAVGTRRHKTFHIDAIGRRDARASDDAQLRSSGYMKDQHDSRTRRHRSRRAHLSGVRPCSWQKHCGDMKFINIHIIIISRK